MRILAIDLSLTGTGYCTNTQNGTIHTDPRRGLERLAYVRSRVLELVRSERPHVAAVEAPSYGSSKPGSSRGAHERGGLHYVVQMALFDAGVPIALIPPTCRAKFISGKGNAGKDLVVQHACQRSGRIFDDNNACDAWILWCMAMEHYAPGDARVPRLPKVNLTGLDGAEWPDLTGRPA